MATNYNQATEGDTVDEITYTAGDDETVTEAVLAALRSASDGTTSPVHGTNRDGDDPMAPLFETVDTDALDAVFSSTPDNDRATGSVEFTHAGYEITATATGTVTVSPAGVVEERSTARSTSADEA
ncbi:HalOD1 output domain-containing protein [Halorientalis salina]|uniref:HalOD1 output domain-containing protein n=1 Tax=Halorientalis salina TaxID=2932266 RepID=UPI0010AB9CAD|nr:HalOD1 output domain-containing protein [Halorientalis salina]